MQNVKTYTGLKLRKEREEKKERVQLVISYAVIVLLWVYFK